MNKSKIRGYAFLVVIFVLFNVLVFAIPFVKNNTFWVSYAFAHVSIIYQIYVLWLAFHKGTDIKSKLYGFPIARIGVIYLIVQLLASLLQIMFSIHIPVWLTFVINAVFCGLAIIGMLSSDSMRDVIEDQDDTLKKKVSNMRELQSLSSYLVGQCNDEKTKGLLSEMAEEFKYSDPVSSDKTIELEADIKEQMIEIQKAVIDGDYSSAQDLLRKSMSCLSERNRLCSISK